MSKWEHLVKHNALFISEAILVPSKLSWLGIRAWQVENQSRADVPELLRLKGGLTDQDPSPQLSLSEPA